MNDASKIRNVAIIAHVDHGKTTLVDGLLKQSNTFRDNQAEMTQDLIMDSGDQEKERGITITAKITAVDWEGYRINIIDTPGHADFVSEVERSLSVLDGAILVISAVEGIQSQTRILFNTLKTLKIPTIIFINKIDRVGANCNKVFEDIKKAMSNKIVRLQKAHGEGSREVCLNNLDEINTTNDEIINVLSDLDEVFLEKYVNGIEYDKNEKPVSIDYLKNDYIMKRENFVNGKLIITKTFKDGLYRLP